MYTYVYIPLSRSFRELAPEFGWSPNFVRHLLPSGIGPLEGGGSGEKLRDQRKGEKKTPHSVFQLRMWDVSYRKKYGSPPQER